MSGVKETLLIPNTQIFDFYEQKLWLEPVKVICSLFLDGNGCFNQ